MAAVPDDLWQHIRSGYNLSPAQMHETVAKQISWYQRNPNYLKTVFGRAEPFIFYVTDELDKAGLPLELALLPIVESTYDPLAYSHSHAVGLWQFIPSTARSLGLHRDRWYDGRRDVVLSTQAAIKYLKYLHRRFDNDWLLALAAYNSGEGNVRKSMARNRKLGKPVDFWSIKLPRETRNYVPQLLALAALIEAAQAQGTAFISDEIYHGIEYERKAVSALEISDEVYVINSFSKYFSMTGWRIGWMVVPPDQVRVIERLAQNMFICAPHVAKIAALAALRAEPELEANRAVYAENRRLMLQGLPEAGFDKIAPPDGAFYIYADVSDLTEDSLAFARDILHKAGVAVTPGLDFDAKRGGQTLRFSYARATADIVEGLARLKAYCGKR